MKTICHSRTRSVRCQGVLRMLLAALLILPAVLVTAVRGAEGTAELAPSESSAAVIGRDFTSVSQAVGYQGVEPFLEFLDQAQRGTAQTPDPLAALFERNLFLFVLAVLGGGFLLNLTPCVLPMIPINLGIIGAGVQASSRGRGFLLGGAYGLGATAAYGTLGLVTILTGSVFGMLQSSPWFNAAIAVVFIVLALALFDAFVIDFSRFQRSGTPSRAGSFGAAFGIGAVSALLAGACVAPVLISTLMLAATLHQRGHPLGLLLPFLLGLGMALPWPFAGAGLSFLPKPGGWMNRVKQAFGVLVLLFAFHYGRLAVRGFAGPEEPPPLPAASETPPDPAEGIAWRPSLEHALEESRKTGKLVMVDLWATWCTACKHMERTTLQSEQVAAKLAAFIPVKIQCERPTEPGTAALMKALDAAGLPTYVILRPKVTP